MKNADCVLPTPAASTDGPISLYTHFRRFLTFVGPTWLIAAMLVDPGAITAALDQGSQVRYALIWISFWSIVFGYYFQELAARIAIVSGQGLAQLCGDLYESRVVRGAIWALVEISVFGDDFQAAVGSAIALHIILGCSWVAAVLLTLVISVIITLFYYWSPTLLEMTVGVLLLVLVICVYVTVGHGHANLWDVLYGWVVPEIPKGQTLTVISSIGGVLTPSTIFLGSAMVLHRAVDRTSRADVRRCLGYSIGELAVGGALSFVAVCGVTVAFANGFYRKECAADGLSWLPAAQACGDITLNDGSAVLHSIYGKAAKYLFGIVLLISGITSMVAATLAGQVLWEGFAHKTVPFWLRVLMTRSVVIIPMLVLSLTLGESDRTFTLANGWINVFMALAMPMSMIPALHFAASPKVMGRMALHPAHTAFSAFLILLLIGLNSYLQYLFMFTPESFGSSGSFPEKPWFDGLMGAGWLIYIYLLYAVAEPGLRELWAWWQPAAAKDVEAAPWKRQGGASADGAGKDANGALDKSMSDVPLSVNASTSLADLELSVRPTA